MVGRDRHRSPVIALELWRRSNLTYTLAAALPNAIPPPAAKFDQAPLDEEAWDQI